MSPSYTTPTVETKFTSIQFGALLVVRSYLSPKAQSPPSQLLKSSTLDQADLGSDKDVSSLQAPFQ